MAPLKTPTTTGTPPTFTTDGTGHIVRWSINGESGSTDTTEEVTIEWPMVDITSKKAMITALMTKDAFTGLNADGEALGDDWYLAAHPLVAMDRPDRRSFTCRAIFTNTTLALRLFPYEDRSDSSAYTSFKSGSRTETRKEIINAKTEPDLTGITNGRLVRRKNIFQRWDGSVTSTTLLGADGSAASGNIIAWTENEIHYPTVDGLDRKVWVHRWTKYFDAANGGGARDHVQQVAGTDLTKATVTPLHGAGLPNIVNARWFDGPSPTPRLVNGNSIWMATKVYYIQADKDGIEQAP